MSAPASEKLRIATHFVLQSPAGQVDQVLRDVRILLGSDASMLGKPQVEAILTKYNQEKLVFAAAPDKPTRNILCSVAGLVDPKEGSVYMDPPTNKSYKFDNINRTWIVDAGRIKTSNEKVEAFRQNIQEAVNQYVKGAYLDESKYAAAVYGNDQGDITIVISAKNVALHNFWSGSWRTVFTLNIGASQKSTQISGSIKINVHYFEDGNVQLNTEFDHTEVISVTDPTATAAAVVAVIDTVETEYQTKLEEMYVDMHKYTFTAMRRFLPVTRNPMDWNPNAHKLAAQLKN
uniref:F-actin-capping protein subunit alpha n=1 Tax=Spongospora subterranea TaxID=70186 RepID=A0A0H5R5N3_9EUKA|eukprot:CRZ09092.1 hypothetical protein [Spongospora subterranea]